MNTALFLDLGGTLVEVKDDEIFVSSQGNIKILPNVVEKLRYQKENQVFVVTNQSAIAEGSVTTADIHEYIQQVFHEVGKPVTDYWACPSADSPYRKPSPGMVLALADKHCINLALSTFVGDSDSDYQCAQSAGVHKFIWASDYFGWV